MIKRVGDIYCDPRCGRGCTWDEYQAALKGAAELIGLLGDQWKGDVWDNLGWCYCVKLKIDKDNWLAVWPKKGGDKHWIDSRFNGEQFHLDHEDPNEGVEEVILLAQKKAISLTTEVNRILGLIDLED